MLIITMVEFARNVAERMGTIIPVEDVDKLKDLIINYDRLLLEWNMK